MTQQRSLTKSTKKPTPNIPIIDPCKEPLMDHGSIAQACFVKAFFSNNPRCWGSIDFLQLEAKVRSLTHCFPRPLFPHLHWILCYLPQGFHDEMGNRVGWRCSKDDNKKQLFKGWGSLRSLPLKNRTPKKDDSFWTHYISSSWILENRKYLQLKESLGELYQEGHLNPLSKGIRLVSCYPRNVREQLNNCTSTMMQSQKFGGKRCSTCLVTSVHGYDEISSFKHIFCM